MSREQAYEQAAVCYRRAGYDLEAARCYRLAGAHRRAAEIYEAAGRYTDAATSFADAGLPELGAWLLVHCAGLPARARALLGPQGQGATGARPRPRPPWPALNVGAGGYRAAHRANAGAVCTIGRDPAADVVVTDDRVSWRHATVYTEGDSWFFEDRGSANGSWFGGQRITRLQIPAESSVRLGSPDDGPQIDFEYATAAVPRDDWANGPEPAMFRHRLVLTRCEIAEGAAPDVIRPVITEVCAALADRNVRSDQVAEDWAVAVSETAARYDQAALVFAAAVRGGRYGAAQRWQAWSRRVLDTEIVVPPATTVAV